MTSQLLEQSSLTIHELEIGTFRFYENLVIGEINRGAQITLDKVLPLFALAWEQYRNKPAVYISDRKNSYSLDPTMHFETSKLVPFVKGYAWVVYNPMTERVARLEQRFLNFPNAIFHSMDPALVWAWKLLQQKQEN